MAEKALLIIDMLNDFVNEGAPLEVPDTRKIIPDVRKEINYARDNDIPVVYVCDTHDENDVEFEKFGWPPHAVKGTGGAEIVDELKPEEGDIVIEKKTYSSFHNTRLDTELKRLGVDTVRLTGCVTHICIMFAAYDAGMLGYNVEVVSNGVAGLEREDHDAAIRIMKNVMGAKII
ncbi:MAG: isochorismatase family cysteine hydrolase [Thermodesulfovibrionales bacterium]